MRTGKIENKFTLLSPLSHIGESVGPDSYLSTQTIIGPDGKPVEVFAYSGNAFRGMLRDAGAKYFLNAISKPEMRTQVPLEAFYLLFSGGSIGGDAKIDIDQARRIRALVPHLSVFGGGVGNQILPGKINVSYAYPVCTETAHIVPHDIEAPKYSWRQMTTEQSFTRTDDAKDEILRPFIYTGETPELMPGEGAKEEKKERPQQMRYTIELLAAGTQLWSLIDYFDMTDIELGALVAAIDEWGKRPVLGGQSRVGMGKVAVEMTLYEENGPEPFIAIDAREVHLEPTAKQAKERYDHFLSQYKEYLEMHSGEIILGLDAKFGDEK